MKAWLICIDDTDDIGTKGTGEIAEEIAAKLAPLVPQDARPAITRFVTRHQLFVHPDIPYTSHNSAMCFQVETDFDFAELKAICIAHLKQESAAAADPGLAILDLESDYNIGQLIAFGKQSKVEVKTKEQAYQLAAELGVDLSEHGGTGQGIIGSLAGLGLRLSGQDGRVKGQLSLGEDHDESAVVQLSVAQMLKQTGLQAAITTTGEILNHDTQINLTGQIKAVYTQHQFALLVSNESGEWRNATKQQLKPY
ncbi:DNA-binding protein [Shewanella sp. 1CM18E]|uniref:DNA-binding protein n=1 Tax=Shewanella sp. 1CM18E TaxID=2929169 RepID=UPI0020BF9641|nr:DNA-binding protein [Shewanella sp. 1CM18E]MCK8045115.1 DNA-binding protein [Shewanella sp. 1CM18E]